MTFGTASHSVECQPNYAFQITKNIGRITPAETSGEIVLRVTDKGSVAG